ncbi:MAG: hypothetical protein QME05_02635 [Candidatus Margulisbacteria bacterium]|nr:hypothetical protein [Candidatus Margulisiibacteriota bacterium]
MSKETQSAQETTIIMVGDTLFRTSGNILFENCEHSPYVLASNPLLSKMEGYLEQGINMLIKRVKG